MNADSSEHVEVLDTANPGSTAVLDAAKPGSAAVLDAPIMPPHRRRGDTRSPETLDALSLDHGK